MISVKGACGGKSIGTYAWMKLTEDGGDFLGYVTSDNSDKYPDGGIGDDGYWYEKVCGSEIISGSITPASATKTITIDNPFGSAEKVKAAFICSSQDGYASGYPTLSVYKDFDTGLCHASAYMYDASFNDALVSVTDESITFNSIGSGFYAKEHYWRVIG